LTPSGETLSLFGEETRPEPAPRFLTPSRFTKIGTATWNYPGWRGIVYPAQSPEKMSSAERLALYASSGRFETVEADFTFYRPQTAAEWRRYGSALPAGFPVVSKVWEEITCERFPRIERHGSRGGERNPNFLNVEAFRREVLAPAEEGFGEHLGPFVFEFGRCSADGSKEGAIPAQQVFVASWRYRRLSKSGRASTSTPDTSPCSLPRGGPFSTGGLRRSVRAVEVPPGRAPVYLARVLVAPGRAYETRGSSPVRPDQGGASGDAAAPRASPRRRRPGARSSS
jgi:hypothetical protein